MTQIQRHRRTETRRAQPAPAPRRNSVQAKAPRRKRVRPAGPLLPMWQKVGFIALSALCLFFIAAQGLLTGYINDQLAQRQAAYDRVVANHPMVAEYKPWIQRYAAENNLQPAFVAAIIMNESSYRWNAESSVGARGLMQLMPDTAEWIAGKLDEEAGFSFDRMFDAETNIRFGCWYLGFLANRFQGDPISVACAYHAGQGEIANWRAQPGMLNEKGGLILEKLRDGPSKNYARKVTEDYGVYQRLYFQEDPEIPM